MTKEQLQVFDDIEELLENRYKIEDNWASTTNQFWERPQIPLWQMSLRNAYIRFTDDKKEVYGK